MRNNIFLYSLLIPLLWLGSGYSAHAQHGSAMDTTAFADSVAIVIQLKDFYDLNNVHQLAKAESDIKSIFEPYEVVYLPKLASFAALIGKTSIHEMTPLYLDLKRKYPTAMIRRMTISQVELIIDKK